MNLMKSHGTFWGLRPFYEISMKLLEKSWTTFGAIRLGLRHTCLSSSICYIDTTRVLLGDIVCYSNLLHISWSYVALAFQVLGALDCERGMVFVDDFDGSTALIGRHSVPQR